MLAIRQGCVYFFWNNQLRTSLNNKLNKSGPDYMSRDGVSLLGSGHACLMQNQLQDYMTTGPAQLAEILACNRDFSM